MSASFTSLRITPLTIQQPYRRVSRPGQGVGWVAQTWSKQLLESPTVDITGVCLEVAGPGSGGRLVLDLRELQALAE